MLGTVKFKIIFQSSSAETCPNDVSQDSCPSGPCCQGDNCCVLHAGTVPKGDTLS